MSRAGTAGLAGMAAMNTGKWTRAIMAAALAGWGAACCAAQLRPLTPEQLAARAEAVVLGRVDAIETVREGTHGLVTRVELAVDAVWKGTATNRLVLSQPGGTLGAHRVVVGGDAVYALGEEVVVFAVRNRAGEWLTLELAQGKFHVTRPASGAPRAEGLFHGGPSGEPASRPANRLPMALDALEARVKGHTP